MISIALLALMAPALASASPEPPEPGTPPSLTGLERTSGVILPSYLRCRSSRLPRKTIFSFFVNQNATVTVVFKRVTASGLAGRGRLVRAATTGKNRLRFVGVVRIANGAHRRLPPGRYRAFFTSRTQFGSSPTSVVGIRIANRQRRC
ncbi:MAG TPA: hypothetical protein VGW80_01385 [Solirubrobacterales bacterium]|nr:hypothetical protein [Solirubrobacterales bacterium]